MGGGPGDAVPVEPTPLPRLSGTPIEAVRSEHTGTVEGRGVSDRVGCFSPKASLGSEVHGRAKHRDLQSSPSFFAQGREHQSKLPSLHRDT